MKSCKILMLVFIFISLSVGAYCQLWKQYLDSANNFYDQRKFDAAIEYYTKAKLELQKDSAETGSYAKVCNGLASSYQSINQFEKAELLYLKAKEIREKVFTKQSIEYASSCNNLAGLFSDIGKYDKAEPLYVEAKNIKESVIGTSNASYARSCNNLANLYLHTAKYDKAEPLYIEAMQIKEKISGKSLDYAVSSGNLASLYKYMGQYKKAEPLNLESKLINEKIAGKISVEYASSCNNLALLYLYMDEYEKAESLFLQALEIDDKVLRRDDPAYAIDCDNTGLLYRAMGQYKKAEMMHLKAKLITESAFTKKHPAYARRCNNLAALYMLMGEFEKAEVLFIEAKQIVENNPGKESPEYATSCHGLATAYASMGLYQKAESFFLESKQVKEKVLDKKHPAYALSCYNLGNLYSDMRQYEKAEFFFEEAYNVRVKALGKDHSEYVESCINLGNLYQNMNNSAKAKYFYTEAFQSQNIQIKKIFQFTSEVEQQSYLKKIADSKIKFLSFNTFGISHSHQGVTYDISLSSRNIILSSSQQLRNAIYNSGDTSSKNKYNSWISSREQIAFWNAKPIADRPAYVKDLEEQANALEKELTRLSSDFKKEQQKEVTWETVQQSLKINEVAIEFVEFNYYTGKRWTDSTYYIALVLRKDKPEPLLVRLFEKKQLDKLLNNSGSLSTDDKISTLYTGNKLLYNLTWKPLEKYLTGISKVYFASAGNLFKISFSALPVNEKQVLGDKYQLVQLNTTASVIDNYQSNITASDKIQLYGGIRYDADSATLKQAVALYQSTAETTRSLPADLERGAGFQFLPGTQKETESIKKEIGNTGIPITILSGTNATEESIKALTGKNSPSVLHIATHGFFFPDPKEDKRDSIQRKFETSGKVFKQSDNPLFRSGLLFAGANNAWQGKPIDGIEDGILTAYEVSNLYLPNTKLVVLSACETALGDIQGSEGVYGLQRAFKMAGVQNLVMSLWKVPDAETAEFMQLFYKNLFAKQTIGNAFYNAQQVMKNKYRAEPYKWAAWMLVR